ncbi:MAG TPA: hypothetical protein VFA11_03390 [Acidimicrobiales bacterium]|nr:hypothetical protein [Acidimicrobiales bacterium]
MEGEQLDFVGKRHRRGGAARRLGAMAAPVAAHGGAVVDDPSLLRYAELVIGAFGQGDIEHGLSRAQIVERASRTGEVDLAELNRRIDTFVDLAMLLPYRDKAHQQRYVVSTDGVAGSLFFRKGLSEGGIEELLQLLGATADAIEAGRHDTGKVAEALVEQRGYVEMWTAAVNRLTDTSTLGELLAERAHHDGDRMLSQVERVVDTVSRHHPSLRTSAAALLTAAQSYLEATQRLLERIVDEGASTRDFSLLDPADYARLATTGTVEELAAVFDGVVWDPARPAISPTDVVAALRTYSPRRRHPRRPPVESPSDDTTDDPLDGVAERIDLLRRQREHAAELLLQGDASVELSSTLRASPWPAALRVIVDLSSLDVDRISTYQLQLADSIVVDTDAHTTWTSDARLSVERPRVAEEATRDDLIQGQHR